MDKKVLIAKDLRGYYKGFFGTVRAVDGVSLSINESEIMGLAGESGCGKSTFAQLITGTTVPLLHYEGGKVEIEGYDIWSIMPETLRKEVKCKLLSYVPQAALNALNPTKRLRDFVTDLLEERTGKKYSAKEIRNLLAKHFESLNLDIEVLNRYQHELSGGMRQRAIIAISTFLRPSLLISDEPTSSLDVVSQKQLIKMFEDLHEKKFIKSILIISHDICTLRQICDRIAIMYAGKIVEIGNTEDIVNKPFHPYTKMLLDSLLPLEQWTKNRNIEIAEGRPPDLRNPPPGCRFHPRCKFKREICSLKEPPLVEEKSRYISCWIHSEDV